MKRILASVVKHKVTALMVVIGAIAAFAVFTWVVNRNAELDEQRRLEKAQTVELGRHIQDRELDISVAGENDVSISLYDLECDVSSVTGPPAWGKESVADGEYCILKLKVTNLRDHGVLFVPWEQYLYVNGNQMEYDGDATLTRRLYTGNAELDRYEVFDGNTECKGRSYSDSHIWPGCEVFTEIIYDIPKGAEVSAIELNNTAPVSSGVTTGAITN